MNQQDVYTQWLQKRCQADVPADFASRTLQVVHGSLGHARCARPTTWLSTWALAAGLLLVAMGQATAIGVLLCTLTGVAQ